MPVSLRTTPAGSRENRYICAVNYKLLAIMDNLQSIFEQIERLSREAEAKESSFLQHILLVTSSTLGILVSLHPSAPEHRYSRWVFVLSVVALGMAVLCNTFSLYARTRLVRRAQKELSDECSKAIRENRPMNPVCVGWEKYHVFCERATYILLVVALISLCSYAVCNAFGV